MIDNNNDDDTVSIYNFNLNQKNKLQSNQTSFFECFIKKNQFIFFVNIAKIVNNFEDFYEISSNELSNLLMIDKVFDEESEDNKVIKINFILDKIISKNKMLFFEFYKTIKNFKLKDLLLVSSKNIKSQLDYAKKEKISMENNLQFVYEHFINNPIQKQNNMLGLINEFNDSYSYINSSKSKIVNDIKRLVENNKHADFKLFKKELISIFIRPLETIPNLISIRIITNNQPNITVGETIFLLFTFIFIIWIFIFVKNLLFK